MAITTLNDPFNVQVPSADSINFHQDETILNMSGGYLGAPTGLNVTNSPDIPVLDQIGSLITNNMALVLGLGAAFLLSGGSGRGRY